jgi:ribosomal protein S24E
MKIKNTKEIDNELFNRKEVEVIVEADVTPKTSEALKLISEKYSMPEDNIKVKGVYGKFGVKEFKVIAHVYKTKADKEKTEKKTKQEKAEEEAAETAAKEAEKKAAEEEAARIKSEKEAKEKEAEAEKKEAEEKPSEENKPEEEKKE